MMLTMKDADDYFDDANNDDDADDDNDDDNAYVLVLRWRNPAAQLRVMASLPGEHQTLTFFLLQ